MHVPWEISRVCCTRVAARWLVATNLQKIHYTQHTCNVVIVYSVPPQNVPPGQYSLVNNVPLGRYSLVNNVPPQWILSPPTLVNNPHHRTSKLHWWIVPLSPRHNQCFPLPEIDLTSKYTIMHTWSLFAVTVLAGLGLCWSASEDVIENPTCWSKARSLLWIPAHSSTTQA